MTDLIKVKTGDLVGDPLIWSVGKTEGLDVRPAPPSTETLAGVGSLPG